MPPKKNIELKPIVKKSIVKKSISNNPLIVDKSVSVDSDDVEKLSLSKSVIGKAIEKEKNIFQDTNKKYTPIPSIISKQKKVFHEPIVSETKENTIEDVKTVNTKAKTLIKINKSKVVINETKTEIESPKALHKSSSEILIDVDTDVVADAVADTVVDATVESYTQKQSKTTHQHSKPKTLSASTKTESSFDMFGDDDVDFRYIMMNYDYTKNKTMPKITKYERALLIGKRAKQIEDGANPNIKVMPGQNAIEIAEEELRQRKIPLIIKRPNGNTFEYWKPADMEVFMD